MERKMTTHFKSEHSEDGAFYLRADLLRPEFGHWDCCDPVAHCIFNLVEAQNEIAGLFADNAAYAIDNEAAFKAAFEKRHAAGEKLMAALNDLADKP
jgi:hypothetical protein